MRGFCKKHWIVLVLVNIFFGSAALAQQPLFEGDDILRIEISGPLSNVLRDTSILPGYVSQRMRFIDPRTNKEGIIPIDLKARGNFRRLKADCDFIPLMVKFTDTLSVHGTVFENQKKLKLVLPCRDASYVEKEWLVYKIYNLINPAHSFKTRRVVLSLTDRTTGYVADSLLGFFIENEKSVAARNGMSLVESIITDDLIDDEVYRQFTLFQYMIGNTDWSIPFLHNIKVIRQDNLSDPIPVPYDFDLTGLVDAPYAQPPPPLELESVRARMYRGYCLDDINDMLTTIAYFNNLKKNIIELIKSAEHLDDSDIQDAVAFIESFYDIINDPEASEAALMAPCEPGSKANIVIMGLGY